MPDLLLVPVRDCEVKTMGQTNASTRATETASLTHQPVFDMMKSSSVRGSYGLVRDRFAVHRKQEGIFEPFTKARFRGSN